MIYTRAILVSALVGVLASCGGGGSDEGGAANRDNVNGGVVNEDNGNNNVVDGNANNSGLSVYGGASTPATVSENNKEDLADAARHATAYALEDGGEDPDIPLGVSIQSADIQMIIENVVQRSSDAATSSLPIGLIVNQACDFGGSLTMNWVGLSENDTSPPQSSTITYEFDNCDLGGPYSIDGTMELVYNGWDDDFYEFIDYDIVFDITYSDGTTYAGTVSCTNYGASCDFSEDYSVAGVNYRVTDTDVDYNFSTDSYDVSATVYHETEGYIVFSATDVTVNSAGNVCSGTISVFNASQETVLSVEFPDCNTYILTYNGVSETYNQ